MYFDLPETFLFRMDKLICLKVLANLVNKLSIIIAMMLYVINAIINSASCDRNINPKHSMQAVQSLLYHDVVT